MAVKPKGIARPESDEPTLKLAVLIDADNAQASIIEGLLAEIATFGEATVKRIYGDFTANASAPQVTAPQIPQPSALTASEATASQKASPPALPKKFILNALGSTQNDDAGWVNLGAFGNYLTKIKPDFDPRLYGFKKLSELVKSMRDDLDIEERKTAGLGAKALYIRRRTTAS